VTITEWKKGDLLPEVDAFGTPRGKAGYVLPAGHPGAPKLRAVAPEKTAPAPVVPLDPEAEEGKRDADEIAEREERIFELAASQWSTWQPMSAEQMRRAIECPNTTEPTMYTRTDGVPLVYPARLNLFMGETESCKTWAALSIIADEIKAGNAGLLVDLEDAPQTAVERLLALGVTPEEITAGLLYAAPEVPFDDLAVAHLTVALTERSVMAERELTVAVVDSVSETMALDNLDVNLSTDVVKFYRGMPQWLADQGAGVILLDHVTKSNEARGRWAIGSERKISGLTGAAYSFSTAQPFGRGAVGRVRVTVSKDRPGYMQAHCGAGRHVATFVLTSSADGSVTVELEPPTAANSGGAVADAAQKVEACKTALLEVIRESPGLIRTEVLSLVKGYAQGVKSAALGALIYSGEVVTVSEGRKRLHYLQPEKKGDEA
jgi:hypothetical protein